MSPLHCILNRGTFCDFHFIQHTGSSGDQHIPTIAPRSTSRIFNSQHRACCWGGFRSKRAAGGGEHGHPRTPSSCLHLCVCRAIFGKPAGCSWHVPARALGAMFAPGPSAVLVPWDRRAETAGPSCSSPHLGSLRALAMSPLAISKRLFSSPFTEAEPSGRHV